MAGIALVAVLAVAALAIAASANGSDGTAEGVDPNLVGKVWKWYQFQSRVSEKLLVPDPNQYTVEFVADGRVHVHADCNTGNELTPPMAVTSISKYRR